MESRDQRIMTLATTLKSSGIAKTDSQARMMAEDMIGVEEHVQKSYEEEHVKAHEYLQTAKNLRVPRPQPVSDVAATQSPTEQKSTSSRIIEPLARTKLSTSQSSSSMRNVVSDSAPDVVGTVTSSNFGTGSNRTNESTSHNTHNAALEAIKSMVQNETIVPLEDQVPITPSSSTPVESIESDMVPELSEVNDSTDNKTEVAEESSKETVEIAKDSSENEVEASEESAESAVEVSEETVNEPVAETTEESSEVVKDSKLDAKKLVELMEEDGKLEEHTREIKEPPKDVKPKEDYAENSIDLGSVFNFNKK